MLASYTNKTKFMFKLKNKMYKSRKVTRKQLLRENISESF